MQAIHSHPSAEELTAFAQGSLEEDALIAIEGHLSGCPECQSKVADAPDDRLIGLLRCVHSRASRCDTQAPASSDTLTHPSQLGEGVPESLARLERYRVFRLLGRGGMGEVYQAEHRLMHRTVAMKVINRELTSSAARVERFRREARAAARLSHPNIVHAYDADHSGETHFLVMEYVEGRTLGKLVAEGGALSVEKACDYVRQAALGLQHAHERGMVHRDIKPENLILTEDGRVKVLDFGLASLTGERGEGLTDESVVMGTPDYMAPEQAEDARSSDIRADIYSLGCTLYFLLTGQPPYPETTPMRKLLAHRDRPVPSLRKARPEVPAELAAVVARMMAKKPKDRYQTPAEVAAALASRSARKPPRWIKWVAAAGLLLALSALTAGVAVHRIQTDKGELVITTESDDVEVLVKVSGKVVRIIDTKTKKSITLNSGVYDLELKGDKGLKLSIDRATLTRGKTVVARIERKEPVVASATEVFRSRDVPNVNSSLDLSPDGRLLLTGHWGEIRVWDVKENKVVHRLTGKHWIARFTPDGKSIVAVGEESRLLRLFDTASGKHLRDFARHPKALVGNHFRMCPNGKVLTQVEGDAYRLWDPATGKAVKSSAKDDLGPDLWGDEHERVAKYHKLTGKDFLYLLPGGREVIGRGVVEDRFVGVYDLETGRLVRKIALEAEGKVEILGTATHWGQRFGDRMALSSADGWLYVVDLARGEVVARLNARTFRPRLLAISVDGRFVAACGAHNERTDLVVWRLPDPPARDKR